MRVRGIIIVSVGKALYCTRTFCSTTILYNLDNAEDGRVSAKTYYLLEPLDLR